MRGLVLGCMLLCPSAALAQEFQLTVQSIMRRPDLYGTAPSNVRYSADANYLYFRWRAPAWTCWTRTTAWR
jgi:hypothetical protein